MGEFMRQKKAMIGALVGCSILGLGAGKPSPTTWYLDRAGFLASVGQSVMDDFESGYPTQVGLTDDQMNAWSRTGVTFQTLSYPIGTAVNVVMAGYVLWDGTPTAAYCNGCNGNFLLGFLQTPLTEQTQRTTGVYGVGMDVVLSQCSGEPCQYPDGQAIVEFGDGTVAYMLLPYRPSTQSDPLRVQAPFFFGVTDTRGVRSVRIGNEPVSIRREYAIDNLVVAKAPTKRKR